MQNQLQIVVRVDVLCGVALGVVHQIVVKVDVFCGVAPWVGVVGLVSSYFINCFDWVPVILAWKYDSHSVVVRLYIRW